MLPSIIPALKMLKMLFYVKNWKDFATPSLTSCEQTTETLDHDEDAIGDERAAAADVAQFSLRRHWETR